MLPIAQTMEVYAAVLFGILLNVKPIVNYGPLSFLDVDHALTYHGRCSIGMMLNLDLPIKAPELPPHWQNWLSENVRHGGHPLELSIILKQHGFSEQAIQASFSRVVQ